MDHVLSHQFLFEMCLCFRDISSVRKISLNFVGAAAIYTYPPENADLSRDISNRETFSFTILSDTTLFSRIFASLKNRYIFLYKCTKLYVLFNWNFVYTRTDLSAVIKA